MGPGPAESKGQTLDEQSHGNRTPHLEIRGWIAEIKVHPNRASEVVV